MMKSTSIKSQFFHFLPTETKLITPKHSYFTQLHINSPNPQKIKFMMMKSHKHKDETTATTCISHDSPLPSSLSKDSKANDGLRRWVVMTGAASVGLAVVLMMGESNKAWAMGPEGPLVEEFWENVRRYALYALTVSTGVLYTVFQPIFELLKNPISAVLILIIIGGSIFIVSQIVSAMVGVSDFSYQYYY